MSTPKMRRRTFNERNEPKSLFPKWYRHSTKETELKSRNMRVKPRSVESLMLKWTLSMNGYFINQFLFNSLSCWQLLPHSQRSNLQEVQAALNPWDRSSTRQRVANPTWHNLGSYITLLRNATHIVNLDYLGGCTTQRTWILYLNSLLRSTAKINDTNLVTPIIYARVTGIRQALLQGVSVGGCLYSQHSLATAIDLVQQRLVGNDHETQITTR